MITEAFMAAYLAQASPRPAALDRLQARLSADGMSIAKYVRDERFKIYPIGGTRKKERAIDLTDPKMHPYMSEGSLGKSLDFLKGEEEWLGKAEKATGIGREYVTAVLNIESGFGKNTGDYPAINALVSNYLFYATARPRNEKTAASYAKRKDFFYSEIRELLKFASETGTKDLFGLTGSYAGAMGPAQFMPSNLRRHKVDLDGDGFDYREIPDAIGSCASLLAAYGGRSDIKAALRGYNNWTSFVDAVDMHAKIIRSRASLPPTRPAAKTPQKKPARRQNRF
jgi:membrane-bound lytic murein transglycosylase B